MTSSFTEAFFQEDNTPDKDIVVVHGVSCTGDRPWVDTDDRPAWLKRDLFEGSNARIISFNYEAVCDDGQLVCSQTGFETVARKLLDSVELWREDEDTRPLAFLGHDLGGVVVKMALVIASREIDRYDPILASTYALVYCIIPFYFKVQAA